MIDKINMKDFESKTSIGWQKQKKMSLSTVLLTTIFRFQPLINLYKNRESCDVSHHQSSRGKNVTNKMKI